MQNNSIAKVPQDTEPELKRFLETLVLKLDQAYGLRGTGFVTQGQTVVSPLSMTVSNPPTQAELQAVADKLDELISVLQTSKVVLT